MESPWCCPICYEVITPVMITNCGDTICADCLNKLQDNRCPMCRAKLDNVVPNIDLQKALEKSGIVVKRVEMDPNFKEKFEQSRRAVPPNPEQYHGFAGDDDTVAFVGSSGFEFQSPIQDDMNNINAEINVIISSIFRGFLE